MRLPVVAALLCGASLTAGVMASGKLTPIDEQPGTVLPADTLPIEAFGPVVIEDMNAVILRDRQAKSRKKDRFPFQQHGEWTVPSRNALSGTHSGDRYVTNKFGDSRMGIAFPEPANVHGTWVIAQGHEDVWASAIRVTGYRDGEIVAMTDWSAPLTAEPRWMAIDLENVDRVVFEAQTNEQGYHWFGLDDFTFSLAGAAPTVLGFDDVDYGVKITGSQYAGLVWEAGTGEMGGAQGVEMPEAPLIGAGPVDEEGPDGEPLPAAAGGGGTAPTLALDFNGVKEGDAGQFSFPPDTTGAVGPNHVCMVVNFNFAIYNKTTGAVISNVSLGSFQPGSNGDPRILYDPHHNRWVVVSTDFNTKIYVAYSATDNPQGTWLKTNFTGVAGSDAGSWIDHPTLGLDANGIYTSCYMVGAGTMTLFAIDKGPMVGTPQSLGTVTSWRNLAWDGAIQPCMTWGSAPFEYVISRSSSTQLRVRRIAGPMTSPTMTTAGFVTIPSTSDPPDAPAQGSSPALDSVDSRLINAVYRDGFIWTTHCVSQSSRCAARWYKVNATTLVDTTGIVDSTTLHFTFPSICPTASGHAAMGFTGSMSTQFAGAYFTGRLSSDAADQMAAPVQYEAGVSAQNHIDGFGRNRWGDYSNTVLDPSDGNVVWTFQSYGRSGGDWGTRVAKLVFPGGTSPPANDACAAAILVPTGATEFTTVAATTDGPDEILCSSGGQSQIQADVWYRWTASCTGLATVDVCSATFDTRLAIYEDICSSQPVEHILACNDNACGTGGSRSQIVFGSVAGTTYRIRIGGTNNATGTGTMNIACQVIAPPNNACASATVAVDGANAFTTQNATTDGPDELACSANGQSQVDNDVWFRWTASCTGLATIDVCNSTFNTRLALYSGSCPSGPAQNIVACNDNFCGTSGQRSQILAGVFAGTQYWIRVGGTAGATGTGTLNIVCTPAADPCPADLDGSGDVGFNDLLELLAAWGSCGGCDADLDGNGAVDFNDLLIVLADWGACP